MKSYHGYRCCDEKLIAQYPSPTEDKCERRWWWWWWWWWQTRSVIRQWWTIDTWVQECAAVAKPTTWWCHKMSAHVSPLWKKKAQKSNTNYNKRRYSKIGLQWTLWRRDTSYLGTLFARHRWVFNCKALWSGDTCRYAIFYPLPGVRVQFASCEYPLDISVYSSSAEFIDLVQNLSCSSA